MRVLFVAPCHVISDERVLRTLRVAQSQECECFLAIDEQLYASPKTQRLKASRAGVENGLKSATLLSLPSVSSNKGLARLQRLWKAPAFVRQVEMLKPDLIHVHESGLLGLWLSFCFKRVFPRTNVFFDYHDWIPFELSVFLGHSRLLYLVMLPLLTRLCALLASRLDGVIAVSNGQASWVAQRLGCKRVLVVPNVRPMLPPASFQGDHFVPALIFVGNVMRSRLLERVVQLLPSPRLRAFTPRFEVFGMFADPAYQDDLTRQAEESGVSGSLVFHGSYGSDSEIRSALGAGALAYLFPLTFVANPSGIEAISSSNKFFSYATLGLPMLVHSSYKEMVSILLSHRAGFVFSSLDELAERCVEIWSDPDLWHTLSRGAFTIAAAMNNDVVERQLQQLYG